MCREITGFAEIMSAGKDEISQVVACSRTCLIVCLVPCLSLNLFINATSLSSLDRGQRRVGMATTAGQLMGPPSVCARQPETNTNCAFTCRSPAPFPP